MATHAHSNESTLGGGLVLTGCNSEFHARLFTAKQSIHAMIASSEPLLSPNDVVGVFIALSTVTHKLFSGVS